MFLELVNVCMFRDFQSNLFHSSDYQSQTLHVNLALCNKKKFQNMQHIFFLNCYIWLYYSKINAFIFPKKIDLFFLHVLIEITADFFKVKVERVCVCNLYRKCCNSWRLYRHIYTYIWNYIYYNQKTKHPNKRKIYIIMHTCTLHIFYVLFFLCRSYYWNF